MNTEWNLDILYKGLDDPGYEEDIKKYQQVSTEMVELVKSAGEIPMKERAEKILYKMEEVERYIVKLINYLSLSSSVDTENGNFSAQQNRVMKIYSDMADSLFAAERMLSEIPDVDELAKESDIVKEYTFYIKELKKEMSHRLSDEVEAMITAMDITGGSAWENLQNYLTSTVKVDYDCGEVTLSEIRNLAYSDDAAVRKAAYEAEIKCYEKIQDSVAFSLNNIKNQVTMLCEKKGYESPLAMTLEGAKMSRATLDAMMEAIEEYLPVFRKYMRHKAKKLGYENGLPWYELFAPLGESKMKFSIDDAKEYLTTCFESFTPEMSDMMREAFENEWIDFYPKKGKSGGAFCAGLLDYKQSRILTNFDGTFGAVDTLAHELGHAFHNKQIENERPLNQDYPMPVAETASTFNEVFLGNYAIRNALAEEKLALLENNIRESNQCIVDIYSRYLFETAVFEQCQQKFLMADDLKAIMLDAQKKAYGDGLDPEYMHPYMWVCKTHYYSSGISFYNFPYSFGNLFAEGLYAIYLKEGDSFVDKYKNMLKATPTASIEDIGKQMGIDLTDKKFWQDSLALMAEQIDEFCSL